MFWNLKTLKIGEGRWSFSPSHPPPLTWWYIKNQIWNTPQISCLINPWMPTVCLESVSLKVQPFKINESNFYQAVLPYSTPFIMLHKVVLSFKSWTFRVLLIYFNLRVWQFWHNWVTSLWTSGFLKMFLTELPQPVNCEKWPSICLHPW